MVVKKAGPMVSDNGNFIIVRPRAHDRSLRQIRTQIMAQIKMLTGVVEVGLFCKMATAAYFGNADGSVTIRRKDGRTEQIAPQDTATATSTS
ncbi:hypothetical protein GALMADRAFT_243069 [Galerina marginata CBS 339.88]|uniref:Uncharacterized protein n=1 Tax=Galerina marginata (strain CBS 339.88) TaxID=685588 RepID=A0A067TGX8_GALM3|nr:hypothetical protein GALMADRAFT_243069 [Galerina marginata CBS 339.88]